MSLHYVEITLESSEIERMLQVCYFAEYVCDKLKKADRTNTVPVDVRYTDKLGAVLTQPVVYATKGRVFRYPTADAYPYKMRICWMVED